MVSSKYKKNPRYTHHKKFAEHVEREQEFVVSVSDVLFIFHLLQDVPQLGNISRFIRNEAYFTHVLNNQVNVFFPEPFKLISLVT